MTSTRGPYDLFSGDRNKPITVGYLAAPVRSILMKLLEPLCEKTGLQGFRPGPTKTGLCSHRRWLEISDLDSRGIVLSK